MIILDFSEARADDAFAMVAMDGFGQHALAGAQLRHDIVEHGLKNRWHTRHHMDIADDEARRARHGIVYQGRPLRHAGHALAGIGEIEAAFGVMCRQYGECLGVKFDGQAESRRHGIRRDVVMGGAYAAGCKDVGVASAQLGQGFDDGSLVITDKANFHQFDADHSENAGQMMGIAVSCSARQDFIADDNHGSRDPRSPVLVSTLSHQIALQNQSRA